MTIELLLAAALVLSAQGPPPRDGAVSLSVAGRVLDSVTGQPVPGALVSVMAGDQSTTRSVEAGAQGEFDLRDVPRNALLQVGPPPMEATHVPRFIRISGAPGETAVVRLDRALVITGRVVNDVDEPMAGVRVIVEALAAEEHAQIPRQYFSSDQGAFRLFGLAPGRYRVCAMPEQPGSSSSDTTTCHPAQGTQLGAVEIRHGLDAPDVTVRIGRTCSQPGNRSPAFPLLLFSTER